MSEHTHPESALGGTPPDARFSGGVELLSRALRGFFMILAAFIIVALTWFLIFGGSFIVDSTAENVVVLKFGKFYKQYEEGWHWFLPYPINKIIRIPIIKQEIRTKTFMPANPNKLYDPGSKDAEMGPSADSLIPGKDGYVLLGDNSIMHSEWIMTYRIADPTKYFMNCMSRETNVTGMDGEVGPDAEKVTLNAASVILKNLLDDSVIAASSTLDIQNTYYEKANYEQKVKNVLINSIAKMDIGVSLESLTLRLVSPPMKTSEAFQMLLLAEANAEQEIETARKYSVEQLNQASSESEKIKAAANAYRKRVVAEVKADANYFEQILAKYRDNPEATVVSLFSGSLADSLAPVKNKFVIRNSGGAGQHLWLKLNQEADMKRIESERKLHENNGDKK